MKDQLKNFFFSLNFFLLRVTGKKIQPFENFDFQTRFSRDWDIFGKNGYVRSTRHKKFFKMSTSCVFRKKWPSDLNLARTWSLDVWSENFFQNFAKNPWNWAYFVQKKITNKSPKSVWVHLVPRFFPEFLKIWPLVELTLSEYENIPGTPTQYNFWPILFQIFHWSFL